jgi:alpha-galactosidase
MHIPRVQKRPRLLSLFLAALVAALSLTNGVDLVRPTPAHALDDGLALTPPMGWNDWYTFFCNIDEDLIKQTADAMVSSGMRDAGYEYVNIDDCWSAKERDSSGNLVPDPQRFPSGMKALADYVHARGLKLGIYTDVGTKTCAGYPGGYQHEAQDARTYASWDIDFVKIDWCNVPWQDFPGKSKQEVAKALYSRWTPAIQNSGRRMVFSICVWDTSVKSWEFAPELAHMWRTSGDYGDSWDLIMRNADEVDPRWELAGPGRWNDPDILMVGLGGLSTIEYQTHMGIWSMAAAPLLAGNDIRNMSQETLRLLTNREVIAVDQDPLGTAGHRIRSGNGEDVWTRPLQNGDRAILLVNRTDRSRLVRTTANEVDATDSGSYRLRDLWAHETTETAGPIAAFLPAHGSAMFRLSTHGPSASNPAVTWGANGDARVAGLHASLLEPGATVDVAGVATNGGHVRVTDGVASLDLPAGWTSEPANQRDLGPLELASGQATATWKVRAPADVTPGSYPIVSRLRYQAAGEQRVRESQVVLTVPAAPPAGQTWLSDVDWVEATNGYGPVIRNRNYFGNPLSIRGQVYPKGLWTHPYGEVGYYLGKKCSRLQADLGVDDATGGRGSVTFQVWTDGRKVYDSGVVRGSDPVRHLDLALEGASSMTLVTTDAGDGVTYDNTDWAAALVTCG